MAVAVFCDTGCYPSKAEVDNPKKEGVASVVGLHHSKVACRGAMDKLKRVLTHFICLLYICVLFVLCTCYFFVWFLCN